MEEAKAAAKGAAKGTTRRSFLEGIAAGWTLFTTASVAGLLATARFLFPNDIFEPPTRFKIGKPSDFAANPDGQVDEKIKSKNAIWVIRHYKGLHILSPVRPPLGRTPNWDPAEPKFKCPGHGSGFSPTGINFEGPAPRPLE